MKTTKRFDEVSHETGKTHRIDVELELSEGRKGKTFSASVGVWDTDEQDWIYGGQAFDSVLDEFPQLKQSKEFSEIVDLWEKYHLNDLNAGTPEQQSITDQLDDYSYDKAKQLLIEKGMLGVPHPENPNKTYVYGTEWLHRDIPESDIKRIESIIKS